MVAIDGSSDSRDASIVVKAICQVGKLAYVKENMMQDLSNCSEKLLKLSQFARNERNQSDMSLDISV